MSDKRKKHKSRFLNPDDGKYRDHSQEHKAKHKYYRKQKYKLKYDDEEE